MLVEWNRTQQFREATKRLANSPSDTFYCSRCGKACSILGRKLVAKDGNRRTYACANCAVPK